ncbi:DUF6157 family protein [Chitinophaga sp. GCM10012297]|uniref:Uncharacterized protein n=1 Tax=Chitinophaga chungangae TaxID=2821488 RepID=A0ABS3Y8H1_9BACT|nr:DUF6157 family protein [Chitinophaga chungangae]MBO9150975.1 hypothetical protein [Chitinophaga chungangae]
MPLHTTNQFNTFIIVADDCPAVNGEIPPVKGENKTAANIQFDMISKKPYGYTSDDVLFQVFADKNDLTKNEYKTEREKFFSKGQACFRASPLTKRYGWGLHYNEEGKIALFGRETKEYEKLSKDKKLKVVKAMRSSR